MPYTGKFQVFEDIIKEIMIVYKHDSRPWLIGYSGGKDSTLLVSLVYEAMKRLKDAGAKLDKTVHVITSDTMVENPIVKNYMHSSSDNINRAAGKDRLNIKASVIYPEPEQTFWSRVIGLGYPTPEPPGFRWCTDRLKIMPMNKFVNERIKESGEIIILLGVRKGESLTRMKTITAREIEGKLLNMHNDIPNAYVYNPITEIPNDLVWEFLLKGDCRSPWGSDMKYLFSLYQGENLGEEKSVLGEVDREKIPVTGNSRFGCWCCTMVKEDKSLQNFINKGATELIPLREFRNELLRMRENSQYRDSKRRNGSVYKKSDGSFGMGPFTLEARCLILEKLLDLENRTGMELITEAELKAIDKMWDEEGDLTCRALVETYHKVKGKKLPWDDYKTPRFDDEAIQAIRGVADKYDIPVELITKLIVSVDTNKHSLTEENNLHKADQKFKYYEQEIAKATRTNTALRKKEVVDSLVNEIKLQATTALKQEIVRKTNEKLRRVIVDDYVEIESIDRYIKLKGRDGASEGQTLSIAYCFLGTLFEDSELEFPFIIDSPTGKMDFEKRQAVADIIPLVFNQMIAFVQSAEVERFADRFYANPDSQYLTVVASPQDQAVVVYEGIDFFDSYQREHKGDEK